MNKETKKGAGNGSALTSFGAFALMLSATVYMIVGILRLVGWGPALVAGPPAQLPNEMLLSLIGMLAILGGAITYVFREIVQRQILAEVDRNEHELRDEIKKGVGDSQSITRGLSAHLTGYSLWHQHFVLRDVEKSTGKHADHDTQILLDEAIGLAREAISHATKISVPKQKETLEIMFGNNLAFYLACKGKLDGSEKEEARSWAERCYENSLGSKQLGYTTLMTWIFVLDRLYGDDEWGRNKLHEAVKRIPEMKKTPEEERFNDSLWESYIGKSLHAWREGLKSR